MRNLADLSSSELQAFLNSFDNVLCDCDGVLWIFNSPIGGVKESIAKLKELGKRVRFVSNNCTHRIEGFQKKLNNFHFDASTDDIAFPTLAIIRYLKKIKYNKEIFLCGLPAMRQEFIREGFKIAYCGPDRVEERLEEFPRNLQDNGEIGAVIIDLDLNLNYVKLLKAVVYLQRPDVLFIIGTSDRKLFLGFNVKLIGPGHFQRVLEDLTGRTALSFGKPHADFNEYIVEKFNIEDPSRTLFIGDALDQDMQFAAKFGYQKLLVLTGVTNIDQTQQCTDTEMIPDYYINSFGDLSELMKNKLDV